MLLPLSVLRERSCYEVGLGVWRPDDKFFPESLKRTVDSGAAMQDFWLDNVVRCKFI